MPTRTTQAQITATIFYEKQFWVATFERIDKDGFSLAKHIFGPEPTDREVEEYIRTNFEILKFGKPKSFRVKIKRVNPKRMQRIVKKEMEKAKDNKPPSSMSQDYIREEIEKNKKTKQLKKTALKNKVTVERFQQKQAKKKEKKKGH